MSATFFIFLLVIGLFAATFLMNRRFGVLGLGLAAGALLATYWSNDLTPILQGQGLEAGEAQVQIVITLLPALALLFAGPTYGKLHMKIIGSALFTLLALALVLRPLGGLIGFDELGRSIYDIISEYQALIIVVGLIVAIIDVMIGRSGTAHHSNKKTAH